MFRMKNKSVSEMDRAKFLRNSGTYVVLGLALLAMTFFGVCDPSGGLVGPKGSAATVGSEVISRAEFQRRYRTTYERYQQQYGEAFNPQALRIANTVLRQLVDQRVLYVNAVDLGMRVSDSEVVKFFGENFKDENGNFSDEGFTRYLRANGYSERSFLEEWRRNLTVQKFQQFITSSAFVSSKAARLDYQLSETKLNFDYLKIDPQKVKVTVLEKEVGEFAEDEKNEEKIKSYYDTNIKEFDQKEETKARHILVSFKGARNATAEGAKRTKDEARNRAESVLKKATKDKAKFAEIAKKWTDEASGKTKGGDLGWFTRDKMVKEFSDAAFALKKGELSGIIESPFGFHIIKVEGKKAAKKTSLDDARRTIAKKVITKEKRPKIAAEQAKTIFEQLNEKKDLKDILKVFGLQWQSTGEVSANAQSVPGIAASKDISDKLVRMKQAGSLYPEVIDVRGSKIVVRLKSRKEADMSKFDETKGRELANTAAFGEGYTLFNSYEKKWKSDLEGAQKIRMNPEFLALDNPREEADSGSE